jgi:hypothetical protein
MRRKPAAKSGANRVPRLQKRAPVHQRHVVKGQQSASRHRYLSLAERLESGGEMGMVRPENATFPPV